MSCETCNKSAGSSFFWNRYIHKLQDLEWWHLIIPSSTTAYVRAPRRGQTKATRGTRYGRFCCQTKAAVPRIQPPRLDESRGVCSRPLPFHSVHNGGERDGRAERGPARCTVETWKPPSRQLSGRRACICLPIRHRTAFAYRF